MLGAIGYNANRRQAGNVMARFWAMCSAAMVVLLALMIGAAGVVGRRQAGELLAYSTYDYYIETLNVYIMDVGRQISTHFVTLQGSLPEIVPNTDGQLALYSCLSPVDCQLRLWNGESFVAPNDTGFGDSSVPVWSVDGQLAFRSCNSGQCDILVWDGTDIANLTNSSDLSEHNPAWSLDGRLAFLACDSNDCDIHVWDDGVISNLTNTPHAHESVPAWSPDGRLAFVRCDPFCRVWLWDGQIISQLTISPSANYDNLAVANHLTWNNRGELAFDMCHGPLACQVFVWDGEVAQNVTQELNGRSPLWSPSGKLAFQSCSSDTYCSVVIWEGQAISTLARTPSGNMDWSTDGQLAFIACFDRNCELAFWDGMNVIQLTHSANPSTFSPVWLP